MRDALIVGINTYQALPNLKAPAKDAEAIAQRLQADGEFRIHRLPEVIQSGKPAIGHKTQVALRDIESALINLFKPKGSNIPQTALFYFSGHGIQREAGIREGYLALSDSQPDKGFYGLSLFWLRRLLQESPVRQRIVILDCCHSGELLNFLEADPGAHAGTDRLFMAASREYETAFEALDSPYSVFTQAILTGLDPGRVEAGIVTNHSLTDHVNHALKGEIQQPLFESSGSEIILTRRTGTSCPTPTPKSATDICPYRGLEYFDESHTEFFFGRESLTAQLVGQLKAEHIVAVVGASGIGKSSLVRAGLLSQLRKETTPLGEPRWRIKLLTPTENPLKSLAAAFIDPGASELERAEQLRRAENFLHDGGEGLAQLVRASLPIHSNGTKLPEGEHPRLLLVIDQFEEVFSLARGSHAEQERKQFFNCLVGALNLVPDCLSLVIVLRTDFITKCSLYEGLAQKITQHQLVVPPLKYEQIKATIIRPAQKVGLLCEPSLVYTMLFDVSGAPGELPLLQYTLFELWQLRRIGNSGAIARLTLEAYQELGGIRGTLQKRATEVYFSLSEQEQLVAKRIFLALTQLGEGTEDTRRRVNRSELVSASYPAELVEQVLEKLVAAKLVITNPEVDVIHEALIRNWSLLRTWISDNREMLRRLRRIEQAAQEWDSLGEPLAGGYLLSGLRLRDAEDFLKENPHELSALAQRLIAVSHQESRRARRESRQLQIAVPSFLVATLAIVLSQYHSTIRSHAEKDLQLRLITARERAAIAQAMLQTKDSDSMAALLVSRIAAEQGGASLETQSSLRAALQNMRLQLELRGHTGAIHQIIFSPNHQSFASASADGTIRLWSLYAQQTHMSPDSVRVLSWTTPSNPSALERETNSCHNTTCTQTNEAAVDIISLSFRPDGRHLAAIAQDSPLVKIWSVDSGTLLREITASGHVNQLAYSTDGAWIATAQTDRSVSVWNADTGELMTRLPQSNEVRSLAFSADTTSGQQRLMIAVGNTVQQWLLGQEPSEASETTSQFKLEPTIGLTHPARVNQATFSSTGRWVATASEDGVARLWDTATGHLLQALSPQAQGTAISAASDNTLTSTPPTLLPTSEQTPPNITPGLTTDFPQTISPSDAGSDTPPQSLLNSPSVFLNMHPSSVSEMPSTNVSATPLTPIVQVQFSPNDQTLAIANADQQIWLWDIPTGQAHVKLSIADDIPSIPPSSDPLPEQDIATLRMNLTNQLLVTASSDDAPNDHLRSVSLWNTQTGGRIGLLSGHQGSVEVAQFTPDGSYIVTASEDGVIRLWTAELGGELPTLSLPDASIAWSLFVDNQNPWLGSSEATAAGTSETPTSRQSASTSNLITITQNGQLQHWQLAGDSAVETPLPVTDSEIHTATVHTAPTFWGQFLSLLREPFDKFTPTAVNPTQPLQSVALATDIAPTAVPPRLLLLDEVSVSTLSEPARLDPQQPLTLSSATLSSDGQMIATALPNGQINIYQVQTNQAVRLIHQIQNWRSRTDSNAALSEVMQSAISPAALAAALPNYPASLQIMSALEVSQNQGDPVTIRQLSFSPDKRLLLGVADDFTIRLWDIQTGELQQVFRGHEATVQQAKFSSDGQKIVTASWDRTVRIWQTSSEESLQTIFIPDAVSISSASFSPDDQQVVIASWDGMARVFKVSNGEQLLLLRGHQQAVLDAQFSPDGTQIATASADGTVYLWDAETGITQAELRPGNGSTSSIVQVSFSLDGQYVAALTKDGKVHLWVATWDMLLKLAQERSLRQLSPDECGRYLNLEPTQCPVLTLGE